MTQMPFYPVSKPSVTSLEVGYVTDAVSSGWISSLGPYVTRFEREFAAFCEADHAVAVCNGTAAIHLGLHALGVCAGDEVIMPDLSFIATANATLMTGACPVFCDVDLETLCLDPKQVEAKITSRTKAILPVHLYGHPADTAAIQAIAQRYNLPVIEDAAEAHGARAHGRRVGSIGDFGTFSFYGNKNFTTGEGGMITTNDESFAERCRFLRDHAMHASKRYWHDELGFNYRMTNIQAALGCAQLERAPELLAGRQEIFEWYSAFLQAFGAINLNRAAIWAEPAYWLVCVEVTGMTALNRDNLIVALKGRGVDARPYFYPMSEMPYFNHAETPVAHLVAERGLNLPTYLGLTRGDVQYICETLVHSLTELGFDMSPTAHECEAAGQRQ